VDVKQERYEAVMALSVRISAENLARKVGSTIDVLIDRVDEAEEVAPVAHLDAPHLQHHHSVGATGRSKADAPEIDGEVHLRDARGLRPGDMVSVRVEDSDEHDLYGVPL
jgi:ribosomal protein S12 methylthiotransferase